MSTYWKKIIWKTSIWLASEVILSLAGTDNLADYSEFVFEMHRTTSVIQLDVAWIPG